MPELPEVETVVRGLRGPLSGKKITSAQVFSLKIRTLIPTTLTKDITGTKIETVWRRAKYILISLNNAHTIVIHLGMTGSVQLIPRAPKIYTPQKHDHFFVRLADGSGFVFSDPRRFGVLDLVRTEELNEWKSLRDLGPEPLEKSFTGAALQEMMAGRKTAIKLALLNQNILVGVGNIYASEALFQAGISPLKAAHLVRGEKAEKLCAAIKKVLNASIRAGGSTLKDYRHATGEVGFFQDRFSVYDREGESCRGCTCDVKKTGGVKRVVQGGRSTFYCATKQK